MAEPRSEAHVPRSRAVVVAAAVAALAMTALDLGSKTWAEENLSTARLGEAPALCVADEDGFIRTQRIRGRPEVFIEDVFELEYAENCGAAFGILRATPWPLRIAVFGTAALVACGALFFMLARGRGGAYFAVAVPFVAAGALGNLADRIRYGYVVDFIHVHYEDAFDYPTFNVADIAITIGVLCWVIDAIREARSEASLAAATPAKTEAKTEASP